MADLDQFYTALRNADAAGDTAGAKRLADYIRSAQASTEPVSGAGSIPLSPGAAERMKLEAMRTPAKAESSFLDKVTGGIEAARNVATGLTSGAVGYVGGALGGIAGSIASGDFGTEEGLRRAKEEAEAGAARLTYQPKTVLGQQYSQNAAEAINDTGLQGLPIGPELGAIGTLAKPAITQAAHELAPASLIAKNVAKRIGDVTLTPEIDSERAALAQKAQDIGIDIPLHTLSDNKFVKMAGEFMDNLPLAGSRKLANEEAFNRFLIDQIGGDVTKDKLTPAVFSEAQVQSGKVIGDTFAKLEVPVDDPLLVKDIDQLKGSLSLELEPTERIIDAHINELTRLADQNGGVIPGTALKKLHSDVAEKLRGDLEATPGMRQRLDDFKQILEDAAARQITDPAEQAAYHDARVEYAKSKVLEPLVAKGGINGVSPQALLGRLTSTSQGKHRMAIGAAGDLGDAAQIAQNFMKERPSSGTAERGFVMGAVTGASELGKAALGIGLGNIYNRFGPSVSRRIVQNTLREPRALIPHELALEDYAQARPNISPNEADIPYQGLLSAEQSPLPTGVPYSEKFSNRTDIPSVEYPILQGKGKLPIQKQGEIPPASASPLSLSYENGLDFYKQGTPDIVPIRDTGLLSLEQPGERVSPYSGVPDTERLATTHDYPAVNYPLRQELLQKPEIANIVNNFRVESDRLKKIASNAVSQSEKIKAISDLNKLQKDFSEVMRTFGISDISGTIEASRPIYESNIQQRLPIQKTYDPRVISLDAERSKLSQQRIISDALNSVEPQVQQIDSASSSANPALQAEIDRIRGNR